MNARPRAVVFDLDGTLVHSAPDMAAAVNATLAELGRPPLEEERIVGFVGNGARRLVERALAASGAEADPDDALARFRRHYDRAPAALTRPYPGVVSALDRLAAAGVSLGVCTNKPEAPARAILAALGLAHRFDVVIGGDTTPALKPDPRPLLAAFAGLEAAEDGRLFVGDSEIDAETAAAADVPFALFAGGYRRGPAAAIPAAHRFDAFADLPGLVLPRAA